MNGPPLPPEIQALVIEAREHLMRGRADLAAPLIERLAPALAGHESLATYLRRTAGVIGFDWPARREPAEPRAVEPPPPSAIELVAFHVDLPANPSGVHQAVDYGAVLALSFESARLRAPQARRVLLTDEATRVPEALAGVEVVRMPLDRSRLMFERMRLQEAFLRGRPGDRATVFMDSDVVVNAEPSAVFAEAFDVGFTYRTHVFEAPFNGGMIFVGPGGGGLRFFGEALRCYGAMAADPALAPLFPVDLRAWWGDQFALAAVVGYRAFAERGGETLLVDGLRVRLFPCDTHNCTLEARAYGPGELRGRYFLHFKGNRKGMQSMYVQAMREGRV